jgi:hypothetical protein
MIPDLDVYDFLLHNTVDRTISGIVISRDRLMEINRSINDFYQEVEYDYSYSIQQKKEIVDTYIHRFTHMSVRVVEGVLRRLRASVDSLPPFPTYDIDSVVQDTKRWLLENDTFTMTNTSHETMEKLRAIASGKSPARTIDDFPYLDRGAESIAYDVGPYVLKVTTFLKGYYDAYDQFLRNPDMAAVALRLRWNGPEAWSVILQEKLRITEPHPDRRYSVRYVSCNPHEVGTNRSGIVKVYDYQ